LGFGIGLHMARARFATLALKLDQVDPTHLCAHSAAKLLAHPLRDRATDPLVALRR
jgi:hypothetical protein